MLYVSSVIFLKNKRVLLRLLIVGVFLISCGCSGVRTAELSSNDMGTNIASSNAYHLHSGDQVDVQVYREPQLSGEFQIDAYGMIRHPLCGSFPAAGLTIAEAEERLKELLGEKYLVNPSVIISIVSAQSSHVVILGEVQSPGVHPIPFGETMTLLQAIAGVGGFTDLASVNRVTVTRTVDGKEKSVRVRVPRLISGQEPDFKLKPNDVIMVPEVVF